MLHAVVENATNAVRKVVPNHPGTVPDCRVVTTSKTDWMPSPITHVWTESGGVFTLVGKRTNGEVSDHQGRAMQLLGELGYSGEPNAHQIEAWLVAEVDAADTLDDIKPLLKKGMSALLHLSIAVANGYSAESS